MRLLDCVTMPLITFLEPDGRAIALQLPVGISLMRGAMDAGVAGIEAQCGGNLACATCHCYVQGALAGQTAAALR